MLTDRDRRELHEGLAGHLDDRMADLMLAAVPPVPISDIATKADVDSVRIELRGEMAELRAGLRVEISSMLPKLVAANVASVVAVTGLVLAAQAVG